MRRFLSKDDIAFCRAQVADPDKHREYSELAEQLNAVGPRKRNSFDRRLRTLRERCKYQKKAWDIQAARARLSEEDKLGFERDKQRRTRRHRAIRKQRRDEAARAQSDLATAISSEVYQNPLIEQVMKESPNPSHLVRRPVAHADAGYIWMPDVRAKVMHNLPEMLQKAGLDTQIRWTAGHTIIKKEMAAVLRKETQSQKRRRLCYEVGFCTCRSKLMQMVTAFHTCLGAALRKPKNKPPSELRVCADAGDLVLCVSFATSTLWAHLAFARYKPIGAVLLRLRQGAELGPHCVALQVTWQPASSGVLSWWWCTSTEFIQACAAAKAAYSLTFWRVCKVEAEGEANIQVIARRMAEVARPFWDGASGKAEGLVGLDADDEEEDEEQDEEQDEDSDEDDVPEWVKDRSDDDIPPERREIPKVDEASDDASKLIANDAALLERGSQTPWVQPFVPGHPATKTTVQPDISCSLNIVATRQQWSARYGGEDEKDVPKKYQVKKFRNKTRSESYIKEGSNQHTAFRTVLLWLWQKHGLRKRQQTTIPPHVIKALEPRVGATLKPCPQCRAGTCMFMEQGVQALAAAAEATAAEAAQRETAPEKKAAVLQRPPPPNICTFCGGGKHSGTCPLFEQLTSNALHRDVQDVSKSMKQALGIEVRTQLGHPVAVPERDCNVIQIPGDGNCLFNAMGVGRLFLLNDDDRHQNIERLTREDSIRYGQLCRASYLQCLRKSLDANLVIPGWPPLAAALQAATGMSPTAYLRAMEQQATAGNQQTWGGYFEAACLAHRWQCQVLFFCPHALGWEFLVPGGRPHRRHRHEGVIPLAWTGGHFDLLLFRGGLPAALLACLESSGPAAD